MDYRFSSPKKITGGISFSLAIKSEFGIIYIIGIRIIKGVLLFPAFKSGNSFLPVIYGNEKFTQWVYQQLIDMGWDTEYNLKLKHLDMATKPISMSVTLYNRIFDDLELEKEEIE